MVMSFNGSYHMDSAFITSRRTDSMFDGVCRISEDKFKLVDSELVGANMQLLLKVGGKHFPAVCDTQLQDETLVVTEPIADTLKEERVQMDSYESYFVLNPESESVKNIIRMFQSTF